MIATFGEAAIPAKAVQPIMRKLVEWGQRYRQMGQKWTTIAKLIRETPQNATNVYEARKLLLQVAKEEKEVLSSLARMFG